ncbi:MAG: hypothetical protein V3T61_02110 [Acidobacteriota bacterium]
MSKAYQIITETVIAKLEQGLSSCQVAEQLGLAPSTGLRRWRAASKTS